MRMKITLAIFCGLLMVSMTQDAYSCVGKTIFVGYTEGRSEEILGNIFSRLISERTGTTVKLKKFENSSALFKASLAGDVDIFVLAEKQIRDISGVNDREKSKTEFNLKYNLVWLKPLVADKAEFMVPVIRKDTLKKFPALPRLIEKLNGIVTAAKLNELGVAVQKKGIKDTIKDFLREQGLI